MIMGDKARAREPVLRHYFGKVSLPEISFSINYIYGYLY